MPPSQLTLPCFPPRHPQVPSLTPEPRGSRERPLTLSQPRTHGTDDAAFSGAALQASDAVAPSLGQHLHPPWQLRAETEQGAWPTTLSMAGLRYLGGWDGAVEPPCPPRPQAQSRSPTYQSHVRQRPVLVLFPTEDSGVKLACRAQHHPSFALHSLSFPSRPCGKAASIRNKHLL